MILKMTFEVFLLRVYESCEPHGFIETILKSPHYKSMEANNPQGMVNLYPRGMVARIYVGCF